MKKSRPSIPIKEQLKLWVKAGGRCEFRGCNENLFRDGLTLKTTNYADIAHIVGASTQGPRGDETLPQLQRQRADNLMLLCKKHHKLIDSLEHQSEYSTISLLSMKSEHERRIEQACSRLPDNKTSIIRLRAKIGRDDVSISMGDIYNAIAPRYPDERELDIDLTGSLGTDTESYWRAGAETIEGQVQGFFARSVSQHTTRHMSIFGFAPIPFLIYLGNEIGSKIPYEIYQKHRSTQSWVWRTKGRGVKFAHTLLSKGYSGARVGVLLSLSGRITGEDLPPWVRSHYPLYELTLSNTKPNPMVSWRRQDLAAFKYAFLCLLDEIRCCYPSHNEIHIFPAVPMSAAIACGVERLPKVHAPFVIYDYNRANLMFNKTLTLK